MTSYDIVRWDALRFGNSLVTRPSIYIKPDLTLLQFFKDNHYAVAVKISDTNTIYDSKILAGVVNRSAVVPNCRPNFYNKTGTYIITLANCGWFGYPPTLGKVVFLGLKGKGKEIKSEDDLIESLGTLTQDCAKKKKECMYKGLNFWYFILITAIIIIILALLIGNGKKKGKKKK